jgi:hypothetical protein
LPTISDEELAKQLKQHVESIESMATSQTTHQVSFTLAERAQAKAGYLLFKSSKRLERASRVLVGLTLALIVLSTVLIIIKA